MNNLSLVFKINRYPSDEEGERALKRLKDSFPSEAQTRYNQRDIEKRKRKNHGIQNTRKNTTTCP